MIVVNEERVRILRKSAWGRGCCFVIAFVAALVAGISVAFAAEPPDVPEPLELDLVRGLGPERGELEANVLGVVPLGGRSHAVEWAPELERAPARHLAFEV